MSVGERAGAELIGASLYELEPGQKTFPYHWQYVEEEMLIVLGGEPTLRTSEGERRLTRGDLVVFRRGPDGAHLVRNDTADAVRILMLSTPSRVEIAEYPDSEKIGIFAEGLRLLIRRESGGAVQSGSSWRFSREMKRGRSTRRCGKAGVPGPAIRSKTTLRSCAACAHGSSASLRSKPTSPRFGRTRPWLRRTGPISRVSRLRPNEPDQGQARDWAGPDLARVALTRARPWTWRDGTWLGPGPGLGGTG
jgi:uncharacterized cupin superfamily protein